VPVPSALAGVNRFTGGFWQDRIDATVFLRSAGGAPAGRSAGSDLAARRAVARQLAALPEVERVWFESRQQALARYRAGYWDRPDLWRTAPAKALPESFRVRVGGGPAGVARLRGDLCGKRPSGSPCSQFVDAVVDQRALLLPVVSGRTWTGWVDVSVFVDPTAPAAQVAALGKLLQATPGVTVVAFESREAAIQRVRALNPKADKLVDYAGRWHAGQLPPAGARPGRRGRPARPLVP
jgi:cell division protein FtsX